MADAGGLAGGGLGGLGRCGLRVFGWLWGGALGELGLGWLLAGDLEVTWIGWRLGVFLGGRGCGAGVLGGEDAGVEGLLAGRQRERGDHGGLDGASLHAVLAPGLAVVAEGEGAGEDAAKEEGVEEERSEQAGALAGGVCGWGAGGDGLGRGWSWARGYLPSMGRVTMEILVMPACLTASMTEAKAPKGTASSART